MSNFQTLTSHLGLPMVIAVLYIGWILRTFSQRIGNVTKMKSYYRWFDVGNVLVALAILGYTLTNSAEFLERPAFFTKPNATLLIFHLPLTLGVGIDLIVTLIYWGWLLRKR